MGSVEWLERFLTIPGESGTHQRQGDFPMPIATIHVHEGQYDEGRLRKVSGAVHDALIRILKIPPDDFFHIIHVLPPDRFLHTPSFLGMTYSDDFILLEVAFISGRPKETRLALLAELNARIVAAAGISPDDLMIQLSEFPGENFSFGQGLAQRAFVSRES
jgi:phenylpyruvate tautomerase PptA (4-oxalocrotonate tautomerase family)